MTPAIQTWHLGERYGRTWALRDCSLTIEPGSIEYAGVVEGASKIGIGGQCVVYHGSNNTG